MNIQATGLYNKQRSLILPLIDFNKKQIQLLNKILFEDCSYLETATDDEFKTQQTIRDKLDSLSEVCECNNGD